MRNDALHAVFYKQPVRTTFEAGTNPN